MSEASYVADWIVGPDPHDVAKAQELSGSLGLAFIAAAGPIVIPLISDDTVSPFAIQNGLVGAHLGGLFAALMSFAPEDRAATISRIDAFLRTTLSAEGVSR